MSVSSLLQGQALRRGQLAGQPAFLEVMPGTASPGHFELLLCHHLLLPSPFFISFSLQGQMLDLQFLLNHHSVLSLAKKSEHLAQRFPRAEYFLSSVLAKHGSELGWVMEKR